MFTPITRLCLFMAASFFMLSFSAQAADELISVNDVKFDKGFKSDTSEWVQLAIELKGAANPDPAAINPNYLKDILVEATLAYENPAQKGDFLFFRSDLTIAAMEQGKDYMVYFFLPGDIIEMYDLDAKRPYGFLRFEVGGRELRFDKAHLVGKLRERDVEGFKQMAGGKVGNMEGVLLNIANAPHYVMGGVEFRSLPSFVNMNAKR